MGTAQNQGVHPGVPHLSEVLGDHQAGDLLLKTMIGEFMGQSVTLVDPAKTAAHHLERMLSERGLRAAQENVGQAHFDVSDVPDSFVQTADLFLGEYKGGPVEQIAIDKY